MPDSEKPQSEFEALLELSDSRFYAWRTREHSSAYRSRMDAIERQNGGAGGRAAIALEAHQELLVAEIHKRIEIYADLARDGKRVDVMFLPANLEVLKMGMIRSVGLSFQGLREQWKANWESTGDGTALPDPLRYTISESIVIDVINAEIRSLAAEHKVYCAKRQRERTHAINRYIAESSQRDRDLRRIAKLSAEYAAEKVEAHHDTSMTDGNSSDVRKRKTGATLTVLKSSPEPTGHEIDEDHVAVERKTLLADYKRECRRHGVRVTDEMIAKAAWRGWNDRTPVKRWKANDSRCTPADDAKIRAVLQKRPHIVKSSPNSPNSPKESS